MRPGIRLLARCFNCCSRAPEPVSRGNGPAASANNFSNASTRSRAVLRADLNQSIFDVAGPTRSLGEREDRMKATLLSLALLTGQSVIPVSDRMPDLGVEALCKSTIATDKEMGLALPQSFEQCMHDEMTAKQQLSTIWQQTSSGIRDQCEGEAVAGGMQSYVDLLTCILMTDLANAQTAAPKLRGASKNRNNTQ